MSDALVLDGSYGEGGGQILRTALSVSAITGRAVHIDNIRAKRPNPGLAAQHLTAVGAVGTLCAARISGDTLGSTALQFAPQSSVRHGSYAFDVAAARPGGSAGACGLVLQAALLPAALCHGDSRLTVRGGTHVQWSPSFDYLQDVWLPTLATTGIEATVTLDKWGWFPAGGGQIAAEVRGLGDGPRHSLTAIRCVRRASLLRVRGRAVAANLPSHIAQRMVDRAQSMLAVLDVDMAITPERVRAVCPGAGIFLTAEYENVRCGFGALGERGKPAETVAEEAASALLAHHRTDGAFETHLADQMILPLAFASADSTFSTERVTRHLATNAWVVEQFGLAHISFETRAPDSAVVTISPRL